MVKELLLFYSCAGTPHHKHVQLPWVALMHMHTGRKSFKMGLVTKNKLCALANTIQGMTLIQYPQPIHTGQNLPKSVWLPKVVLLKVCFSKHSPRNDFYSIVVPSQSQNTFSCPELRLCACTLDENLSKLVWWLKILLTASFSKHNPRKNFYFIIVLVLTTT